METPTPAVISSYRERIRSFVDAELIPLERIRVRMTTTKTSILRSSRPFARRLRRKTCGRCRCQNPAEGKDFRWPGWRSATRR